MFHDQLAHAIDGAHPSKLDYLARLIWQSHAAGALEDNHAQLLAEALAARRGPRSAITEPCGQRWPKPRRQQSPDKQVSIQRRRRLAASGPLPPTLACRFTVCELAVLRLVGDHVAERGFCDRSIAELAARAGTCATIVRNVLRLAARLGLVTVERRPRPGRKNLTNVVRIICREWLQWLERGERRRGGRNSPTSQGIGFRKTEPTAKGFKKEAFNGSNGRLRAPNSTRGALKRSGA
jgi:hypothetical protein